MIKEASNLKAIIWNPLDKGKSMAIRNMQLVEAKKDMNMSLSGPSLIPLVRVPKIA